MIRHSLTVLVAITSLYAALLAVFALVNEPAATFTYVKLALAAIVIGCGLLVVHWQWTGRPLKVSERFAIFFGGLGLIEIGTANTVWTAHLGLVSGDWEYYGFVGGMLISVLGALAATWLAFPEFLASNDEPQLTHAAR